MLDSRTLIGPPGLRPMLERREAVVDAVLASVMYDEPVPLPVLLR